MTRRTAFVTGGSRGIGRGIALRLAEDGFRVALTYLSNRESAEAVAGEIGGFAIQMDAADRDSIRVAVDAARSHLGPIEVLVNNAATSQHQTFLELTDADWDAMMAANLRGPFALSQEVLPDMLASGSGRIINITSIGGQHGGIHQVHYAASKAGLINLTRSLGRLYGAKGITSNAVSVGLVLTDMSAPELGTDDDLANAQATIPMRRLGTVDEIAAVVSFLAGPDSSYVNGQVINANGGMFAG
ncbi:MAG: NAD(P)-dependent dehydrogenase (short-subunit alcohol dehydrogenase family) [Rhodothermales bacterium]|jgi:NAD(P)-dependent dehydrogenase (short-subunit alcohol dehydrogenase family)